MAANMVATFNQYFIDHLSERMQASARSTFDAGRWERQAPLGYLNVIDAKPGATNLVPDKSKAHFIVRAFELMATGDHKAAEVHRILVAEGFTTKRGKPVAIQTFNALLKNPVYVGLQQSMKYEETKPGLWEPLVDQYTFRIVQMILSGKRPTSAPHSRNDPRFPLRGTLVCDGWGQPLTGGNAKGESGKGYQYYWCRTSGCRAVKNIPAKRVEGQFIEFLKQLRTSPDFEEKFLPVLTQAWKASSKERAALISQAKKELAEQEGLKKKLARAFLMETIDRDTYDQLKREFDEACEGYEEMLAEMGAREAMSDLFWAFSRNVVTDVSEAWSRASLERRQRVQKVLFPHGIRYSQTLGILNTDKECIFSLLRDIMSDFLSLASPTGFEPVLSP